MSLIRTGGKSWRRRSDQKNPNKVLTAKITVVCVALTLGIVLLVIFAYVLLPSVISDANRKVEEYNLAKNLYDMTIEQDISPGSTGAAVFEQPNAESPGTLRFARDGFAAALQQNSDIVGRVTINPCDIAYLVTQTDDNKTYLSVGYDRKQSENGTIFLDYRCDAHANPLSGHYILYGHNAEDGSMFHGLEKYKNEDFFNANRVIRFDSLYKDYEWEIFSAYVTDTSFYYIQTAFSGDKEWLAFLNTIQQRSQFKTDVPLSADDVVLTLSTCSFEFDDARFVIHARLITDQG